VHAFLLFAGSSSAARKSLRRKCHRCRGTNAGGKRVGEAGENVLQTGRVQAGKPVLKLSFVITFFRNPKSVELKDILNRCPQI